jgi:hypothetical protein
VNQSPVIDTFRVLAGGAKSAPWLIQPLSTRFYTYGAGMEVQLEPGERLSHEYGAMVIRGFRQTFTELRYIVGTVSDHVLTIAGQRVSLRDLCGRNAQVRIYIE